MAVPSKSARKPVFPRRKVPPAAKRPDKGGEKRRRRATGAKLDDELQAYVDELVSGGTKPTDIVVKAIQVQKDVSEVLGSAWWEVERRANEEGVRPGIVLARLAQAQLEAEKKRK